MVGKIKFFDQWRGYGYILSPEGQEVYFHTSACLEDSESLQLFIGEFVCFDLIETRTGFEATNLRKM